MKEKVRCLDCEGLKSAPVHNFGHPFNPPPKAGGFGSQKKALAPRSEKMADYYERPGGRRDRVAEAVGDGRRPCKVQSPVCTGTVQTLHEPSTRARSGGLRAAVEAGGEVESCDACNGWMSRTPEGILWATERGLLRHAPPSAKIVPRRHPPRFG